MQGTLSLYYSLFIVIIINFSSFIVQNLVWIPFVPQFTIIPPKLSFFWCLSMPNIVHCSVYSCLIIILETVLLLFPFIFQYFCRYFTVLCCCIFVEKFWYVFFFLNSKENKMWANLHKIKGPFPWHNIWLLARV